MRVQDVMKHWVIDVSPRDQVSTAQKMMLWGEVRHLPVVEAGAVIGVLSERDILSHRARRGDLEGLTDTVAEIMSSPAHTAGKGDDLSETAARMTELRIGCLPVIDDAGLAGIVTRTDVLAGLSTGTPTSDEAVATPTVDSVMTERPATVRPDDYLLDALGRMASLGVRHLPVVDGEGRAVGILSDRDIRTAIGDPRRALAEEDARTRTQVMRVGNAMASEPLTVPRSAPIRDVIGHFVSSRVGAIPVTDDGGRVVGIVSYVDLLKGFGELFAARRD